jgi:hypothetical protein
LKRWTTTKTAAAADVAATTAPKKNNRFSSGITTQNPRRHCRGFSVVSGELRESSDIHLFPQGLSTMVDKSVDNRWKSAGRRSENFLGA